MERLGQAIRILSAALIIGGGWLHAELQETYGQETANNIFTVQIGTLGIVFIAWVMSLQNQVQAVGRE
jgi:hypothetical protein